MPDAVRRTSVSPVRIALALAAVYVVWGSTYLGIRVAIESIPPLLMAGARFTAAGILMIAYARGVQRAAGPTPRQWRDAAIVGACLLLVGNGGVTLAERALPSGLTAMLIATVPMFLLLFGWASGISSRPSAPVAVALGIGFGGVYLLVRPPPGALAPAYGGSILTALTSAAVWAAGSLYATRADRPASPVLNIGMQMFAGGLLLALGGMLHGELAGFDPAAITARSGWALFYLTAVGALVGFSAYIWLLGVASPALVGTYAFVNPAVAVLLGWALAGERVTAPMIFGMAAILSAVALILRFPARPRLAR